MLTSRSFLSPIFSYNSSQQVCTVKSSIVLMLEALLILELTNRTANQRSYQHGEYWQINFILLHHVERGYIYSDPH